MIKSMTAFAKQQIQQKDGIFSFEIRSVNHRYLDLGIHLPESFKELEQKLRQVAQKYLQRGKVDAVLKYQMGETISSDVIINQPLLGKLNEAVSHIKKVFNDGQCIINILDILKWQGMVQIIEGDKTETLKTVSHLFEETLKKLDQAKETEGKKLKEIIEKRLTVVEKEIKKAKKYLPNVLQTQKDKLIARFKEAKLELDQNRFEQEMVLFAQKTDVSEELDRLELHVLEVKRILDAGGATGRRLDFLMQELNREANTLGSKSVADVTTRVSIELKVLIEQMREQIQNIE